MNIQIIGKEGFNDFHSSEICVNELSKPYSLDSFEINIVNLTSGYIWRNNGPSYSSVTRKNDFMSLRTMIENCKNTKIVYLLPQNITFAYHYVAKGFAGSIPLKDMLHDVTDNILPHIIPRKYSNLKIAYENTKTIFNRHEYKADFYFCGEEETLTKSDKSEKSTTIKLGDNVFVTTLDILNSQEKLLSFISMFMPQTKSAIPEWMAEIEFADDSEQKDKIRENEVLIETAKENIEVAKDKLAQNMRYKSVLYANGDELVDVVFEMLEKMLDVDLSQFADKKKEDFLIKKQDITFIGEIKGVTSNVKSEHVSQIDVHYYGYLDKLQEENKEENVKQILIMNSLRNKRVSEREEVHENQINLAKRNGCLIIETVTLLRIFEKVNNSEVTSAKCIEVFKEKTGLLKLEDFR